MDKLTLKNELKREPGIMSYAYPYVGLWSKIEEKEVIDAWSSLLKEPQSGILYINIPFCLSKCNYCNFASNYGVEDRHKEYVAYVDAVEEESKLWASILKNIEFEALYFGGGTPTILCEKGLERIIRIATSNFSLSPLAELSVEIYPWKTMLREKLRIIKNNGINSVSIGVQDFDDEVLAFAGRRYTGKEAVQIVGETIELFETVNIDLICGLPKQERWKQTIETTLDLKPQRITVQPFSNRHPEIKFKHKKYVDLIPDLDEKIEMYSLARQMLTEKEYIQISRHMFIRANGNSRYEQRISESEIRLGIGAHSISLLPGLTYNEIGHKRVSTLPGLTYKNFTSLDEYKSAIQKGKLAVDRGFKIDGDEKIKSYLFYSLNADYGKLSLNEKEFSEIFGKRIQDRFPDEIQALKEEGLMTVSSDRINLTPKGIYFTSLIQRMFYNPEFIRKKEEAYRK